MVVRKETEEIENEKVKIENKDNDKIKVVYSRKNVWWKEKICDPKDIEKLPKNHYFPSFPWQTCDRKGYFC